MDGPALPGIYKKGPFPTRRNPLSIIRKVGAAIDSGGSLLQGRWPPKTRTMRQRLAVPVPLYEWLGVPRLEEPLDLQPFGEGTGVVSRSRSRFGVAPSWPPTVHPRAPPRRGATGVGELGGGTNWGFKKKKIFFLRSPRCWRDHKEAVRFFQKGGGSGGIAAGRHSEWTYRRVE